MPDQKPQKKEHKKKTPSKKRSNSTHEDPPSGGDVRRRSESTPNGRKKSASDPPQDSSSGRRERKPRTAFFQPYLSREEVDRGLKRGQLIRGELRINPRAWEEAYVPHPDGRSDVFVDGVQARNRSLNSDLVVVRLHDRSQWRVMSDQLARAEAAGLVTSPPVTSPPGRPPGRPGPSESGSDSDDDVIIESETTEIEDEFGNKCSVTKNLLGQSVNGCVDAAMTSQSPATPPRPIRGDADALLATPTRVNDVMENPHARHTPQRPEKKKNNAVRLKDYPKDVDDVYLQKTGEVVYIEEKCHSRASCGLLKPMADKNPGLALFCPTDSRVPRICVPTKLCPDDFTRNPESYANTLCVARITKWDEYSKMPTGVMVRSLGEAGDIEAETEGVLMAYDVDYKDFDQKVLSCLPETPWRIPDSELARRRDLRQECVFTIDPETARDLDDALSCNVLGNGLYEVGVHIADVSYFLQEATELDKVASKRATSVYLVQKVIPMLPRLLCEQLCSLNPDHDKLTFSVIWTINQDGEIVKEWFGRTVIRSRVKLAYQHAQKFIDDPTSDWTDDLREVTSPEHALQIKTAILNLHKLAVKLRADRFTNGALRLEQSKLSFSLEKETGMPNGCAVYKYKESNKLIEEFMLLANMAVAHKLYNTYPNSAMLRRHPEPQCKMMDDLVAFCNSLGIEISGSSSQELQACLLRELGDGSETAQARWQVLTQLCTKPMQFARYFCTGSLEEEAMYRHYALNVPLYTHFTSPIRRYADVIVHRQLAASLGLSEKPGLSDDDIEKQARVCNLKKNNSKRVQEFSSDLFFSVFVKESGPLEREGMVMNVLDRSFDVLVPAFGVVKRVYCDKLPLSRTEFQKRDGLVPELTLFWESGHQQEVTIFTRVWCTLAADKQPMKWQMTIAPELPSS